jgi:CHAT domain-containing protein
MFYKNWIKGMDKYSAFRFAQNSLKENIKSRYGKDIPFYWGAFIMVGK